MKLNTKFLNVSSALCVVFAVSVIPNSCLSQNAEQDPVFFDDDLQQVPLSSIAQPVLSLDMLQQQAVPRWHSMFTQIPGDFARFGDLTMSMQSVPTLAGLGLLTISLIETDHRTYHATRSYLYRESATFRGFSKYAVLLGDGTLHAGIAAAFAGYGLIADDSRALTTASETAEAFLATGFTGTAAEAHHRKRKPDCRDAKPRSLEILSSTQHLPE